jgi:two-component system response regulator HydG
MNKAQILIVHSDSSKQSLLTSMLQTLGHNIEDVPNDSAAVKRLERGGVSVVISSVEDPHDADALELLSYLRRKHGKIPVLLLFANMSCDKAREAARLGATVLRYPTPATELRAAVTQALELYSETRLNGGTSSQPAPQLHQGASTNGHHSSGSRPQPAGAYERRPEVSSNVGAMQTVVTRNQEHRVPATPLVGESQAIRQVHELAMAAAPTRTPVVIIGEEGTGKSLLARLIHQNSPRHDRSFIEVVCGGLDENQIERELFGQSFGRSGENTGLLDRPGKALRANGGTLFIDEVSALSPNLQRQLLRLLQDGEFEPQGAVDPIRVDVRLILASSESLTTLVEQGRFRRDLYDRVGVVCLRLPALRDRGGDIETLADHFRERFSTEFSKQVVGFTSDAIDMLCRHDWPGNVRELESVVQRGVALCTATRVTSANLSIGFGPPRPGRSPGYSPRPHTPIGLRPLKEALEEPEKQIIIQALQALNWNRQETARVLDINRTTLYKKMKKYGLLIDEPAMMN